jgi:malate dehydrogenase (oxaloacetate-decarboxylating)
MASRKYCLVVMPFSGTTPEHPTQYWDSFFSNFIKPNVEDIGYACKRSSAEQGGLADVIRAADVFIGVSGKAGLLNNDMVKSMNHDAIIFALSNPDPEILPSNALKAGARIVATGRSDFPNQINNAVVFPSVLRALLDMRAKGLDENILVAASYAISSIVEGPYLKEDYIIPNVNDPRILSIVTQTLKEAIKEHMTKGGKNIVFT